MNNFKINLNKNILSNKLNFFGNTERTKVTKSSNRKDIINQYSLRSTTNSKNKNIKFHTNKFNKKIKIKSFKLNNDLIQLKKFFKEKFNLKKKKKKKLSTKENQLFITKHEIELICKKDEKFEHLDKKTDMLLEDLDKFLIKIKNRTNILYFEEPTLKNCSFFNNYKNYLDAYKKMMYKINRDFNNVLIHYKNLSNIKKEYIDYFESKFTKEELDIVKFEFQKKKFNNSTFDINKLYNILKKLYFFKKINKEYALIFIQNSELMCLKKETFLFKKGDVAKNMYVILNGNVTVCYDYYLNSLGYNFKSTITQWDDGYDFGNLMACDKNNDPDLEKKFEESISDLKQKIIILRRISLENDLINQNLNKMKNVLDLKYIDNILKTYNHYKEVKLNSEIINEKNKLRRRVADIYTTENTYLIKIENEIYNDYILKPYEKENNEKLNLILKIPLFKSISKVLVLPLIQILRKKKFKIGENIIEENTYADRIYFVNKGIIDVVINTKEEFNFNKNLCKREGVQTNFDFSVDKRISRKISTIKIKSIKKNNLKDKRVFNGDVFLEKENYNRIKTTYKTKLIYVKTLKKFSFFGEMSLVTKNNFPQKLLYLKKPEIYSYIANTSEVELFYFKGKEFNLLSKPVQSAFKNHIFNYNYEKDIKIKEGFKTKKNYWKKFKNKFLKKEKKFNHEMKISKYNDYKKI